MGLVLLTYFLYNIPNRGIIMRISPFKTPNIVAEVNYGSHVYGSNTHLSDKDCITIVNHIATINDTIRLKNVDLTVINNKDFQERLNRHDIMAIECYFLPPEHILVGSIVDNFTFDLDIVKLRQSFSKTSSNSWVKCKKKINVEHQPYIGMKSMFHSLRILDLGIQLATTGKIYDYSSSNHYLKEILDIGPNWERLNETFKPVYNKLHSEFKKHTVKFNHPTIIQGIPC